ncbi:MAG: ChbG/HpnK family deacetylase [archaeon]
MVKELIVTADDLFMHPDFNHGILKAVMAKRVNAVSAMMDARIMPRWQTSILKKEYVRLDCT